MRKTLDELLDYAEECLNIAPASSVDRTFWQRQSEVASALARAVAAAAIIQFDEEASPDA